MPILKINKNNRPLVLPIEVANDTTIDNGAKILFCRIYSHEFVDLNDLDIIKKFSKIHLVDVQQILLWIDSLISSGHIAKENSKIYAISGTV